jgi:hypothetical protein
VQHDGIFIIECAIGHELKGGISGAHESDLALASAWIRSPDREGSSGDSPARGAQRNGPPRCEAAY